MENLNIEYPFYMYGTYFFGMFEFSFGMLKDIADIISAFQRKYWDKLFNSQKAALSDFALEVLQSKSFAELVLKIQKNVYILLDEDIHLEIPSFGCSRNSTY